jgi:hypothetical protein
VTKQAALAVLTALHLLLPTEIRPCLLACDCSPESLQHERSSAFALKLTIFSNDRHPGKVALCHRQVIYIAMGQNLPPWATEV